MPFLTSVEIYFMINSRDNNGKIIIHKIICLPLSPKTSSIVLTINQEDKAMLELNLHTENTGTILR
jgi:hypothetical protein